MTRCAVVMNIVFLVAIGFARAKNDYECRWEVAASENSSNAGKKYVCTEQFNKRQKLVEHIKDEHIDDDATSYTCQWKNDEGKVCEERFDTVDLKVMRDHVIWHTGNNQSKKRLSGAFPFKCTWEGNEGGICGKRYKQKYLLDEHMNGHLGIKPFVCNWKDEDGEVCGKAYVARSGLAKHRAKKKHRKEGEHESPDEETEDDNGDVEQNQVPAHDEPERMGTGHDGII